MHTRKYTAHACTYAHTHIYIHTHNHTHTQERESVACPRTCTHLHTRACADTIFTCTAVTTMYFLNFYLKSFYISDIRSYNYHAKPPCQQAAPVTRNVLLNTKQNNSKTKKQKQQNLFAVNKQTYNTFVSVSMQTVKTHNTFVSVSMQIVKTYICICIHADT